MSTEVTKYCLICAAPFQIRPSHAHLRHHCSRACGFEALRRLPRRSMEERLWSKVQKGSVDECWPWTASTSSKGYGQLNVDKKPRIVTRLLWELLHGPIPEGLWVLHTCDNPPCCNPAHLFLGTAYDNTHDMLIKSRNRSRKGQAPITWKQRQEIQTLYETGAYTKQCLALRYDVQTNRIENILRGPRPQD